MSTYEQRMAIAESHEEAVLERFRRFGWHAHPFGQTLFSEPFRRELKRSSSDLRWLPDVIAIRGTDVVLADAKTELRDDTPNHAIEIRSVESHIRIQKAFPRITIYYVWPDFTICTPNWLKEHSRQYTGPTTGSGTPMLLTPKDLQWSFDAFFAPPRRQASA